MLTLQIIGKARAKLQVCSDVWGHDWKIKKKLYLIRYYS